MWLMEHPSPNDGGSFVRIKLDGINAFLVRGPARCSGFHPGTNEPEIRRIDHQSVRAVATEASYISIHDLGSFLDICTGRYNGPRQCTILTGKRCLARQQARS